MTHVNRKRSRVPLLHPSLAERLRARRRRSRDGFSELYRANVRAIIRTLGRLGVSDSSLPDVAHEVFLVAFRRREVLHATDNPRSWLLSVARQVAANHRRKTANRLLREQDWMNRQASCSRPNPEVRLAIEEFLTGLCPDLRDAFVLGDLEGLTREELGDALGVAPGTAYGRLRAARECFSDFFFV